MVARCGVAFSPRDSLVLTDWGACDLPLLQYIQQNIRSDCSNIDKILEPPEGQDEGVWKYEHLRYV